MNHPTVKRTVYKFHIAVILCRNLVILLRLVLLQPAWERITEFLICLNFVNKAVIEVV